ncbi:hypothetical protein BABINDRAFT_111099 [Babjeviella inositovora NRRL Y-12698]|uniref:GPI-anchored wall transfer protein n=1 Tax=Babjeviella inositovora NRRL Y-12698 TaxID=984486 RepID=A0A1E3QVS5_9ASCO|nr:uncharacterized protein BABINDRAFT_111099 [Babjeviella inositovora NRRL Y-12698]ODQ81753.1 hypothetical protein BABINDRAFT_111099 [Babjeviella inositovora NRRL Y-12698]
MSSLKERKEEFVSNLNGGTTPEIYAVTTVALTAYFIWCLLKTRTRLYSKDNATSAGLTLVDFAINWLGLLLSITTYNKTPLYLNLLLLLPAIAYTFVDGTKTAPAKASIKSTPELLPKKAFLTAYRSGMIVITNVAILAVDFGVFPRRFAKVETWGTSLMDLGVGSFVFSMGLATSRSIIKLNASPNNSISFTSNFVEAIKSSVPLLVLGTIRLVSVKNLEYQEHTSEYGIHWNFFFTLGFLPPFMALLEPIIAYVPRIVVALGIGYVYELLLANHPTLLKFIILGERTDLFSANKEGIFSFIGYLSIYLSGQSLGWFLLTGYKTPHNLLRPPTAVELANYKTKATPSKQAKQKLTVRLGQKWLKLTTVSPINGLIIMNIVFHGMSYYLDNHYNYGVSRRMANLPYVVWVNAYNATFLLGFVLIEKVFFGLNNEAIPYEEKVSENLESINRNGLAIFLLANLATGMVNMSVNTLDCDRWISMLILVAYSLFLSSLSIVLLRKKIFIKV